MTLQYLIIHIYVDFGIQSWIFLKKCILSERTPVYKKFTHYKYFALQLCTTVEPWNKETCKGTGKIFCHNNALLYQDSLQYYYYWGKEYCMLYQGLCYGGSLNRGSTIYVID